MKAPLNGREAFRKGYELQDCPYNRLQYTHRRHWIRQWKAAQRDKWADYNQARARQGWML